jgi:hypothetical protein
LPILLLVFLVFGGCLASLPRATWLWWAVPPVELYYSDAYFHSTMAHGNPAATARVQMLYKTAPGRPDQLVDEHDVVADGPGNQRDIRIPMHLSTTARSAGWSELIQGPKVEVNAAELEQFLRAEFYGGQSFWQLFERPILGAFGLIFVVLAVREWFTERLRRVKVRRLIVWPESLQDDGQDRRVKLLDLQRPMCLRDRPASRSIDLLKRGADWVVYKFSNRKCKRSPFSGGSPCAAEPLAAAVTPPQMTTIQQTDSSLQPEPKASPSSLRKKPVRGHSIFPGTSRQGAGNEKVDSWDESQWID